MNDTILSTREAAAYLGTSENTLRFWRYTTRQTGLQVGPVSFRLGRKLVKYRRSDLDAWLAAEREAALAEVHAARLAAIA